MQIYLDYLIKILQDQNLIKQLNIFQNSEDFNKVINFLSTLSQHTEQTQIQDFGFESLDLLSNTAKVSNVDKYDFDLDDPELMNISVGDYLNDLPNNNLLLNQPEVVQHQPTLPKPELISQPIFNPCEEIIDEIIEDDDDGVVN
ncbi:hypothetical protein PIROE2DRAFT_47090, partial [Piromyces sp. E2]